MTSMKSLTKGTIKIAMNTYDEYIAANVKIKGISMDIYRHLDDFKEDIYWIYDARPFENYTVNDVINECTEELGNDKLIFAQAGTIQSNIPIGKSPDVLVGVIDRQRKVLFKSNFYNVIFNRIMGNSYGNGEMFLFNNDKANDFITNNIGDVTSDKIINRVSSEAYSHK